MKVLRMENHETGHVDLSIVISKAKPVNPFTSLPLASRKSNRRLASRETMNMNQR